MSNIKREEKVLLTSVRVKERSLAHLLEGKAKSPAIYDGVPVNKEEEACLQFPLDFAISNTILKHC